MERRNENLLLILLGIFVVFVVFSSNISGQQVRINATAKLGGSGVPLPFCRDSDGGIVPEVFGIVTQRNRTGEVYQVPDECWSYRTLAESYCTSRQGPPDLEFINCENYFPEGGICEDGVCVRNETNVTWRVFVTNERYRGNLGGYGGGGFAAADLKCRFLAQNSSLGGRWKAWISIPNSTATDRLYHSPYPYVKLDDTLVANNWDDLTDGSLSSPINLDNEFNTHYGGVWTGTNTDGSSNSTMATCYNWSSSSSNVRGQPGVSGEMDEMWTFDVMEDPCDRLNRLYCFEQPE